MHGYWFMGRRPIVGPNPRELSQGPIWPEDEEAGPVGGLHRPNMGKQAQAHLKFAIYLMLLKPVTPAKSLQENCPTTARTPQTPTSRSNGEPAKNLLSPPVRFTLTALSFFRDLNHFPNELRGFFSMSLSYEDSRYWHFLLSFLICSHVHFFTLQAKLVIQTKMPIFIWRL